MGQNLVKELFATIVGRKFRYIDLGTATVCSGQETIKMEMFCPKVQAKQSINYMSILLVISLSTDVILGSAYIDKTIEKVSLRKDALNL